MTDWHVSDVPGDAPADDLFHGTEWMGLLERGFGCDSLYVINASRELAAGISTFRAGPFRIGYLGFPVGGFVGQGVPAASDFRELQGGLSGSGLACLRVPVSAFNDTGQLDFATEATPETAILDLQSWNLDRASTNRRRDIRRAQRSPTVLVDASDPADGALLFDLYQRTMERKKGALRYTADYFTELIRLAQHHPNLRVLLARLDESIAGFNVVARHGSTGYYLHGALDWKAREHRPAALLMNEAIEWARSEGCRLFNMLSSPRGQQSLVRYKEQWGGETREHRTYTVPLSPAYPIFRVAERLYRLALR